MLWLLWGPPGFICICWISFALVLNLFTGEFLSLLIFFLYLDLYVLGDDKLISKGSFMQTETSMCLDPNLN